jgi:HEPN domain-containing protein
VNTHPHRLKRIASFMMLARDELKAAKLLASQASRPGMFMAQQSVEKLLRAVIEAEDHRAGTTHNIRELAAILGSSHVLYDDFLAFDSLSTAATRYRYPIGSGALAQEPPPDSLLGITEEIDTLFAKVARFLADRQLYSED